MGPGSCRRFFEAAGRQKEEVSWKETEKDNLFFLPTLPFFSPAAVTSQLAPFPFLRNRSSGLGLPDRFPQQRVAADFLWHRPLPEAAAAADEGRRGRLARSGQACVLRGAPLAARLVVAPSSSSSSSQSPRLLSLEAIAEMGGRESEFGEEDGDDDDDDEGDSDDDDEGRGGREAPSRPSRPRPSPPPIPATLLTAGPPSRRAPPPELYALDERKNLPGAHYRIRFPPTAKLSRRLEGEEEHGKESCGNGNGNGGGGNGGGTRRKSALSSLAAAASAWEGRPSLLTARLMTGGEIIAEPGEREGGEEALRRLVREGIDWGWLSSLAGNDGDDGDDDDDGGGSGESPSLPPTSPSCWLPPSAVDCEWAGGGGGSSSSSSAATGSISSCGGAIVLPASYATHDRVFAQVRGRRRVLVAAPSDALEK